MPALPGRGENNRPNGIIKHFKCRGSTVCSKEAFETGGLFHTFVKLFFFYLLPSANAFLQLAAKCIEALHFRCKQKSLAEPWWCWEEGKGARVEPCCAAQEEEKLGERVRHAGSQRHSPHSDIPCTHWLNGNILPLNFLCIVKHDSGFVLKIVATGCRLEVLNDIKFDNNYRLLIPLSTYCTT